MNSLPLFQIDGDLLDTAEVASNYNVGKRAITQHFSRNQDELIEGIHYHIDINPRFKTKIIKWTLEGVYMLGFFVKKSEVAKEYRHKVAQAIAQARAKQLAEAETTRKRNLELTDKVADLEANNRLEAKHHQDQINGYLGKLAVVNKANEVLKAELIVARSKSNNQDQIQRLEAMLHNTRLDRDFYMKRYHELQKTSKAKEHKAVLAIDAIQSKMEQVFTAMGAVKTYIHDGDEYFLNNNELLRG